jgi:hypothetical protein
MAAYFKGMRPNIAINQPVYANCAKVIALGLYWSGLWTEQLRDYMQGEGNASTVVDDWYESLIALTQIEPASERLLEGWGNLGSPDGDRPATPAFTSCGLTVKGWTFAEKLLGESPKENLPNDFFRCL